MEHIINADFGDKIIIHVPNKANDASSVIYTVGNLDNLDTGAADLISKVCNALNISHRKLTSKDRHTIAVTARFYLAFHLWTKFKISKSDIGRLLNRDHSNIIYAIKTFKNRVEKQDYLTILVINKIEGHEAN